MLTVGVQYNRCCNLYVREGGFTCGSIIKQHLRFQWGMPKWVVLKRHRCPKWLSIASVWENGVRKWLKVQSWLSLNPRCHIVRNLASSLFLLWNFAPSTILVWNFPSSTFLMWNIPWRNIWTAGLRKSVVKPLTASSRCTVACTRVQHYAVCRPRCQKSGDIYTDVAKRSLQQGNVRYKSD